MTLGEKITALRKRQKCSQAHLSRALDLSRDAISKYERDEMNPSVDNAKRIADYFGVSLDYLVSPEAEAPAVDRELLERMREVGRLAEEDRAMVLRMLDAMIRDAKTRETYTA